MSTAVQRRRGTSVEHLTFTGLEGELTIDTDKETAVIHDGATAGGFTLLREDMANYDGSTIDNFRSKSIDDNTVTPTAIWSLHDNGSKFGSPTGGDGDNVMGPGTINVEGVYVNGGQILTEALNANITADWQFSGNISFTGDVTNASSTNTNVKDNLIILNDEETATGVAGGAGTSGLRVDRGFTNADNTLDGATVAFANANPDTIIITGQDWTADAGAGAGDYVAITGTALNDGVYLIGSVTTTTTTNDTLVLDADENLQVEAAVAATTITILDTPVTQASLIFDEADDTWKIGLAGSEAAIVTAGAPGPSIGVGDTDIVITDTGSDGTITMRADATTVLTMTDTLATFGTNVSLGSQTITTTGAGQFGSGSGAGIARTDGTFHVHTASAGTVVPESDANDLVIENSGHTGISILSPDANDTAIYFGTPSDAAGAQVLHDYTANLFRVSSLNVGHSLVLEADNAVANLTLSGASGSELATFAGDVTMSKASGSATLLIDSTTNTEANLRLQTSGDGWNLQADDGAAEFQIGKVGAGTVFALNYDDLSATFAGSVRKSNATGLTAAGTVQGDALQLTADVNNVTTVAASTGVKLPTAVAGMMVSISNAGANPLTIYPFTGDNFDALSANAADTNTLAAGSSRSYMAIDANTWQTMAADGGAAAVAGDGDGLAYAIAFS